MNLFVKLTAYLAVISYFERCLAFPVPDHVQKNRQRDTEPNSLNNQVSSVKMLQRVRKQDPVVQPDWTSDSGFGSLFTDYNVRVTDKKLEETEAIRDIIQETVNNDTYAVELDESDFEEGSEESNSENDSERNAEPEAETEAETGPDPEPEPEPKPEPEPEPKPKPIIEIEQNEKFATKERTSESTNSSKKGVKKPVSRRFLTWLKRIFLVSWGAKS